MKKALFSILVTGVLCGCSMLNPYQSEFSCPDTFKGKCASVREVYMEDVIGGAKEKVEHTPGKPSCMSTYSGVEGGGMETACSEHPQGETDKATTGTSTPAVPMTGNPEERNYNQYRSALYDRFSGLLKEPQTPVVAPPKVMRVLLLPYTGQDNEFYMLRYVYFFVDKPRWILGDSVTADGEDE